MQNIFGNSPTSTPSPLARRFTLRFGLVSVILLFTVSLLWPGQLLAQATAPTPLPLAPVNTLVAIAGGHGAALWQADTGASVGQVEPGARLIASKRSADGQWLYVTDASGTSGWAAASSLIVFYRLELLTEAVTITPATPTAEATPAPAATASTVLTNTTTAEPTATAPASATTVTTTTAPAVSSATDEATVALVRSTTRLNIRSGPGTTYAVIGKAEPSQPLTIVGRTTDGSWVEVQLPEAAETTGWVAAQYVAIGSEANVAVTADSGTTPQTNAVAAPAPAVPVAAASGLRGKLVFQSTFGGPRRS